MKRHIDADKLKKIINEKWQELADKNVKAGGGKWDAEISTYLSVLGLIDSLQQEQSDKESLNESQQEFVNVVTERMLKEGPIPALKGKQKAEFEKEFNRFKQITGMINFPAHMEIYKEVILWFMAWGADNLPNLNKATGPDELDFQQEQPEVDLEKEIDAVWNPRFNLGWDEHSCLTMNRAGFESFARHFYKLGLNARKEE